MWPLFRPGRGSGASPRKRSAGRASTTCADPRLERLAHFVERGDEALVEPRREEPGLWMRIAEFERPALLDPFREAAFEDADLVDAISAQRPPDPRRRVQAEDVVDDEAHAVAEPERASSPWPARRVSAACAEGPCSRSAIVSMSKNTAPGICPSRNSTAPKRPVLGRCHEPSITPRSASPSSAASSAGRAEIARSHRRGSGQKRRERDAHAAVDPALLLDLDDRCAADFAGARDMGASARLEVEALDGDEADAAGSGRRLDRHRLDQRRIGLEFLVGDPAQAHAARRAR